MDEPKVISLKDEKFQREVVPGVAFMKHTFGNELSVALFKIEKGKGGSFPKHYHKHGEEVGIQLRGSAKVFACGKEYIINEGEAIIIPADCEHAGIFGEEEGLLLAIATPPRKDYGPPDW
ncbi:MAG: hypothetical protein C5B44_00985 [Acidobacteria bacterium]|nr:MAG: hypothetical protein C5B44_00985 [Acidobacteriota bacterium]